MTQTNGLAICLVTRAGAVGVDAEDTSQVVDVARIAKHFLCERDRARLMALADGDRSAAFFELWVFHEAYVKGSGKGLGAASERVGIRFNADNRPLPIGNWQFSLHHPRPNYVAAAAIRQPRRDAPPVPVVWLNAALFQTRVAVEI
ncbi:MAG: 4'-phosphopantetheinyl transferase superfamily protein [Candidatus Eremiobacteraeota bacterium]|nr:4'-phosphopantetheinyl transferase superfamily protein [Candidatus Eremiobacteraeota bacterium]